MNISPDGVTVRFKTEPEDLFYSEQSGAKPNTVRIIDHYERQQLKKKLPHKIIVQHQNEIFLRTITNVYVSERILGKYLAIFSWTNENHHHTKPNETERDPYAHTMSIDEQESSLCVLAINVSVSLLKRLDNCRGDESYDEFISKLLGDYERPPHQHTMPNDLNAEEREATEEEEDEDKKLALIGISKGMSKILVRLAYDRSMDAVIRELYQAYLDKHIEERGPLHD